MKTFLKTLSLAVFGMITVNTFINAQSPIWSVGNQKVVFPPLGLPEISPLPIPSFAQFQARFGQSATQQLYDEVLASEFPFQFYNGKQAHSASNAMADENGNLLFFIIGTYIFDCEGFGIGHLNIGDSDGMPFSSGVVGSEIMIVPDPANCSRYYLFFSFASYQSYPTYIVNYAPHYAILDLDRPKPSLLDMMNNSVFVMSNNNNSLFDFSDIFPNYPMNFSGPQRVGNTSYAALKNPNVNEYTVLVSINGFGNTSTEIFICKLDKCGLQYTGNKITAPIYQNMINGPGSLMRSELEAHRISNGNIRVAVNNGANIYCDMLNQNGQPIPNQNYLIDLTVDLYDPDYPDSPVVKGIEFFGDNHLYYTNTVHNTQPSTFNYMDLSNLQNSPQPILGIPNILDFQHSMIESDGSKLILVGENTNGEANRLGAWTNPSNPANSTFIDNYVSFQNTPILISNFNGAAVIYGSGGQAANLNGHFTKTYILPDQIDGYNYFGRFEENQSCCLANKEYSMINYNTSTINLNEFWSPGANSNPFGVGGSVLTVAEELRIPAGKTLTISNMELRFAKGAKLVVENGNPGTQTTGGHLILENCILTNDARCGDELWSGIEVWGVPSHWQGGPNNDFHPHGVVTIRENTTITNACRGVLTGKTSSLLNTESNINSISAGCADSPASATLPCNDCPTIIIGFGGGIVYAENSSFLNNLVDVEMRDFIGTAAQWPQAPNPSNIGQNILVNNKSRFESCSFWLTSPIINNTVLKTEHVLLHRVYRPSFIGCNFKNWLPESELASVDRGIGIHCQSASCRVIPNGNQGAPISASTANRFMDLYIGILSTSYLTSQPSFVYKSIFENNYHGVVGFGVGSTQLIKNNFQVKNDIDNNSSTSGSFFLGCNNFRIEENNYDSYLTNVNDFPQFPNNTFSTIVHGSGENNHEIYKNQYLDLTTGIQLQGINGLPYNPNTSNINTGLRLLCNVFRIISENDIAITSGRISQNQGFCFVMPYAQPAGNSFSSDAQSHFNMSSGVDPVKYYLSNTGDIQDPIIGIPSLPQFEKINCGFDSQPTCASKAHPIYGWVNKGEHIGYINYLVKSMDSLYNVLDEFPEDYKISEEISAYEAEHENVIREMISELFNDDTLSNYVEDYIEILRFGRTSYHKMQLGDLYVMLNDLENAILIANELDSLASNEGFSVILRAQIQMALYESLEDFVVNHPETISNLYVIADDDNDPVNKIRAQVLLSFLNGDELNLVLEYISKMNLNSHALQNKEEPNELGFLLYPNPNSGMLFINSNVDFENATLSIFTMSGVKVFERLITHQTQRISLDVNGNNVQPGVYFVSIKTDQGEAFQSKLIIE